MSFNDRDWFYLFRELDSITSEKKSSKLVGSVLQKYSKITKNWNEDLNSEWTCRIYFATNMILNATVLLKNAEYAEEKNVRIVRPYLEYYAVLSLLRCVVYTLPELEWKDGELIKISHTQALNLAIDCLAKFSIEKSQELKNVCKLLKAQRELISYRAPASGDRNLSSSYNITEVCTILAEVAQFNSELLEASVTKNASKENFVVHSSDIRKIVNVEIEGQHFNDRYDSIRLSYVQRKQSRPYNLALFMTEGQTEDFIGAWDDDDNYEDDDSIYHGGSPCDWQDIFDIP
ncbi:hypothetical protein ACGTN6_18115 [Halomonas sp. THAF12]|uniref:hypothetical protein n=1 Tax=Halomonas sp. B23F22_10 TaxID=3459515 RepID=UPI00373F1E45